MYHLDRLKKGAKTLGSILWGVGNSFLLIEHILLHKHKQMVQTQVLTTSEGVSSVLKHLWTTLHKLVSGTMHQNSQQLAYSIKDNLFRK